MRRRLPPGFHGPFARRVWKMTTGARYNLQDPQLLKKLSAIQKFENDQEWSFPSCDYMASAAKLDVENVACSTCLFNLFHIFVVLFHIRGQKITLNQPVTLPAWKFLQNVSYNHPEGCSEMNKIRWIESIFESMTLKLRQMTTSRDARWLAKMEEVDSWIVLVWYLVHRDVCVAAEWARRAQTSSVKRLM